jgi:hypothetical protein
VRDLSVEVRRLDHIAVHEADGPDACASEVGGRRATQSAEPDDQDGGVFEEELAWLAVGEELACCYCGFVIGGFCVFSLSIVLRTFEANLR